MPLAPNVISPQPTSVCSCSCSGQFHASSYSPCADNAMLHVCTVCLSPLFPRAFSDATGACSVSMHVQPQSVDVNTPKVNRQPVRDRTQLINAPASCPLGGQFWGALCMLLKWSWLVPVLTARSGDLGIQTYSGFFLLSFFTLLVSSPLLLGIISQEITCTQGLVSLCFFLF